VRARLEQAVATAVVAKDNCEGTLADAIEAEHEACAGQGENPNCLCNEARTAITDQTALCVAVTDTYEAVFCEHQVACRVFQQCHAQEMDVYTSLRVDIEAAMTSRQEEYRTFMQVDCLMNLITTAMLSGTPIDHSSLAACDDVSVDHLAINFPVPPSAPTDCPAPQSGDPQCGAPVTELPTTPAVCPAGWLQIGEAGADIGGCGLQGCGERYGTSSEADCAASCDAMENCDGFSYAPMDGDRNHPGVTACTLYNSINPTGLWPSTTGEYTQVFCGREEGGATAECPSDALEKCQGNTPCIDMREGPNHHHLMWLNEDGTAHVDGEANGINGGDGRTWTCTRDGNGVGLVGNWNCPDFYDTVITITSDYADDFTAARTNEYIHVCVLPEPQHTGYGQPCTEGTATINGVSVCTVASNDGNSNPWVLFGDIDHQISNFVSSQVTSSPTSSGQHIGDSVQVGTFTTGTIGTSGYSLDIGQFCSGGSCSGNFDLMIQYGNSDVFSHSENGYGTTNGGFINNGHTAQGVVIGEHGMWGSNSDSPSGYYATFCAYNGGCRVAGNDFWAFSTHGVYPNSANSVVCGMYYGVYAAPWKNCPGGDNIHRMRYFIRSSDLQVELPSN